MHEIIIFLLPVLLVGIIVSDIRAKNKKRSEKVVSEKDELDEWCDRQW